MPAFFKAHKISSSRLLLMKQVLVLVIKTALIIFIILSLILVIVERVNPGSISDEKISIYSIFRPITGVINKTITYVNTIFTEVDYVINSNNYAKRLNKIGNNYKKAQIEIYKLKEENQRLKKVLNYVPEKFTDYRTIKIVARSPGPYIQSAFVESEDADILNKNDVVINQDGLVGQVESVSGDIANVILITDKRSNVPIKTRNSGKRAILVGNGSKNPELDFILSTKNIVVGEEILTSGDGGIFPPDIPVGYIEKIDNNRVIIETYVNWESLEYVFVVK